MLFRSQHGDGHGEGGFARCPPRAELDAVSALYDERRAFGETVRADPEQDRVFALRDEPHAIERGFGRWVARSAQTG